ncbi:MAG: transketolase C-terminal domain-containing protein [Acidimicrobiales bacterium]
MSSRTRRPGLTLADGIKATLADLLEEDERVVLMGEDIGRVGGVFRITAGLLDRYGADRVIDSPLSEAGLVGVAIGRALAGAHPIVEIQFDGFVLPALNQIIGHLAKMPARLDGQGTLPVTVRVPFGGRIHAAEFHSESPEALFAHSPDLAVVAASRAETVSGLLRSVVEAREPAIFLEPKREYRRRRIETDAVVTDVDHRRCAVVRDGTDVTLVAYGPTVSLATEAADQLAEDGISCQVVDLVSLAPLDTERIFDLVASTGRVTVISEAVRRCSIASEVVSQIAEHAFADLKAPPAVVSSPNHPPPPPIREAAYFPSTDAVCDAVRRQIDAK